MKKPTTLLVFRNHLVACFDEYGQQIGELQIAWHRLWAEHATRLGYDVDGVVVKAEISGVDHHWTLTRDEEGDWCLR